jgi:hypothetical protein
VDDCVPVDLGDTVDYAQLLRARAAGESAAPAAPAAPPNQRFDAAGADTQALRRLFLELPSVMCALRLADLPPQPGLFARQQALLQRLDLVSLEVNTMPALGLGSPGVALAADQQARRARAALRAAATLDEAWALLARANCESAPGNALIDDAERIAANLEHAVAERRASEGAAP